MPGRRVAGSCSRIPPPPLTMGICVFLSQFLEPTLSSSCPFYIAYRFFSSGLIATYRSTTPPFKWKGVWASLILKVPLSRQYSLYCGSSGHFEPKCFAYYLIPGITSLVFCTRRYRGRKLKPPPLNL
ncbi:hypothetical protein J6590_010569 [Homalodisca vitripennis]|nr:hypothetical protein J6590_010569 [Homalodisca vitripennis]